MLLYMDVSCLIYTQKWLLGALLHVSLRWLDLQAQNASFRRPSCRLYIMRIASSQNTHLSVHFVD